MFFSENPGRFINSSTENRDFIVEVTGLHSTVGSTYLKYPIRQSGRTEFTVPYSRMSREIRRIALRGGKIISIRPSSARTAIDDLSKTKLAWWPHVSTQQPESQYYFGPFETAVEAESHQAGYVEDLRQEGATNITCEIRQCQPEQLTIGAGV